mmetsp:Transcript_19218/g.42813  ORF Transcript_19218/g.42813 Transcript_19218/m.42813 type:complete len:213 (+) Transcript_19218:589-1227(+)
MACPGACCAPAMDASSTAAAVADAVGPEGAVCWVCWVEVAGPSVECIFTALCTATTFHAWLSSPCCRPLRRHASSCGSVTPPCLKMISCMPCASILTTLDSMPNSQLPLPLLLSLLASEACVCASPSKTCTPLAPRSVSTCAAVVGDTCPNLFAEGAAMGTCAATSSRLANAWRGHRTPTKPVPAVTSEGTRAEALAMRVSGPGQKAAMSSR